MHRFLLASLALVLLSSCPKASPPVAALQSPTVAPPVAPLRQPPPIAFARLAPNGLAIAEQERWDWPGDERFATDWTAGGLAYPVVRGRVAVVRLEGPATRKKGALDYASQLADVEPTESGSMLFDPEGEATLIWATGKGEATPAQVLSAKHDAAWIDGRFVAIALLAEEVEPPDPESEDAQRRYVGRWEDVPWAMVFEGPQPKPVAAGGIAWAEASYATTLMDGPLPSRRVKPETTDELRRAEAAFEDAFAAGTLEALRGLVDQPLISTDSRWEAASELARAKGDLELAVKLRAPYLPSARCSMDQAPQQAGLEYAELCAEAGNTACFLQLMVAVMGNNFGTFMVRSSYGDAAAPTYGDRLGEIGIDQEQFLLGLVFLFEGDIERKVHVGPSRVGRAMASTGQGERFEELLVAHARDEELDEYNRLRVVWTLSSLLQHRDGQAGAVSALRELLEEGGLAPEAEGWIRKQLERMDRGRK